ncbi:MAG: hypothetical protein HYW34_01230 [Candidatus Brennerbacteria bacterium]|nr:hypothetical protein [Candidatus Brennerbacteria bacterium]
MVQSGIREVIQKNNQKLYQYPECGFHYADDSTSLITGKEWAEKRKVWREKHRIRFIYGLRKKVIHRHHV